MEYCVARAVPFKSRILLTTRWRVSHASTIDVTSCKIKNPMSLFKLFVFITPTHADPRHSPKLLSSIFSWDMTPAFSEDFGTVLFGVQACFTEGYKYICSLVSDCDQFEHKSNRKANDSYYPTCILRSGCGTHPDGAYGDNIIGILAS